MAGLTKQHFTAIANAINEAQGDYNELVNKLIEYFKTQNPNFDETKFKEACLK